MTTENGANMVSVVGTVGFVKMHCFAHIFHFLVNPALHLGTEQPAHDDKVARQLCELLNSCNRITGHFLPSLKAGSLL